jgi:hypothetical protein
MYLQANNVPSPNFLTQYQSLLRQLDICDCVITQTSEQFIRDDVQQFRVAKRQQIIAQLHDLNEQYRYEHKSIAA